MRDFMIGFPPALDYCRSPDTRPSLYTPPRERRSKLAEALDALGDIEAMAKPEPLVRVIDLLDLNTGACVRCVLRPDGTVVPLDPPQSIPATDYWREQVSPI